MGRLLSIAGPRAKTLAFGVSPIVLVGFLYETVVRKVAVSARAVHLCDLRARELALFGIQMHGQRVTPSDWLQAHWVPALDAICAFPYATFILLCVVCAGWLYSRDYPRMLRFAWCFLWLNVAGFATYYFYPAAPPWYYHAHGCEVDVLARASEGPNLARVDAWLGWHYFAGMYARSRDVFGAMPSLHVAYSLLVVLEGWSAFRSLSRFATVAFWLLMCFSAVYLDHHWVLDVVAGCVYCLVVVAVARALSPLRKASTASEDDVLNRHRTARGAP